MTSHADSCNVRAWFTGYREKPPILLLSCERLARAHLHREQESLERVAPHEHYTALRATVPQFSTARRNLRSYAIIWLRTATPCTRPGRRIAPSASPRYEGIPVASVQG